MFNRHGDVNMRAHACCAGVDACAGEREASHNMRWRERERGGRCREVGARLVAVEGVGVMVHEAEVQVLGRIGTVALLLAAAHAEEEHRKEEQQQRDGSRDDAADCRAGQAAVAAAVHVEVAEDRLNSHERGGWGG